MPTKRTLTRQLDQAREGRDRAIKQRDEARSSAAAAIGNQRRMAGQLTEVRDELDQARAELKDRPAAQTPAEWAQERARLRQQLALSERARAALDAQLLQVGRANDALSREAYDRSTGVAP